MRVQDGVMLHRVLPWLWRLADEDEGRPELPWELQQQLLEALHCCPVAEDPQVSIWWAEVACVKCPFTGGVVFAGNGSAGQCFLKGVSPTCQLAATASTVALL
jgi:hypothetical protein